MTEIIGGVLMTLGGGMLSASSLHMLASRRPSVADGVKNCLRDTPTPADRPGDIHQLLEQLAIF